MIGSIIFLVIGLTAMIKKKISISSKRQITGQKAQYLGMFFLVPAIIGFLSVGMKNELLGYIAYVGYGLAVLVSIYLVITAKNNQQIIG